MPNDYPSNSAARRKALLLGAMDAHLLLVSSLQVFVSSITPRQILQVQKVLDAAVVNPVVKKELAELDRRSVTHRAGSVYMVDEKIERRSERVAEGMIWITEDDKHIRLDFEKLIAKDALEPITDNPDEEDYLKKVKNTLKEKGVWLRVGQERINDARSFVVWLSLGYDGDAFLTGTKLGFLDREAILGNQLLGARYYEEVLHGPVRKALEKQIDRLDIETELGDDEHRRLIRRYEDAFPGIAELSDAVGGADLPGRSIWAASKKLISNARELSSDGDVIRAQLCLLAAAVSIRSAAQLLSTYAEKSSDGAGSVVTVLRIVKTAGEIAEAALVVTGAAGLVRGLVSSGATANTAKTAVSHIAKDRSPAAYYQTNRPGPTAFAKTTRDPNLTRGGSKILRQRILGWNRDVQTGLDSAYAANGRREVSLDQLEAICKVADGKWGNPMQFMD